MTVAPVLEEAARRGRWQAFQEATSSHDARLVNSLDASRQRVARGRGIACCFKNVGYSLGAPESTAAWVELYGNGQIERAIVGCVGADVGQGAHTAFIQIAAEVLQIDPAQSRIARGQHRHRWLQWLCLCQPHDLYGG